MAGFTFFRVRTGKKIAVAGCALIFSSMLAALNDMSPLGDIKY